MPGLIAPAEFRRAAQTIIPSDMKVWGLPGTDRAKALACRESFFFGNQHTHKAATWTGQSRDPGVGYLAERMKPQGFVSTNSATVPFNQRRPDAPNSLHRQIVTRFSDMLLGENARPTLGVPADPTTEAYIHAVMESSASWATLQQARDIKGRLGSAAIVLTVIDGQVTTEALNPVYLHVMEWEKSALWIPRIVVEQKLITKIVERDPNEARKLAMGAFGQPITDSLLEVKNFWRTRAWTSTHIVDYVDVPEDWAKEDPYRQIPMDGDPVPHKAGRCPVVWMQNTRNPECPEGEEDYVDTYEVSDKLDTLRAFTCRSTIANTDPTLIVKDTPARLRRNPAMSKGHGQRISVDTAGDVRLLESTGDPVRIAMELWKLLRHDILQTSCTVIMDPETLGTYKSAESIRLMMKPMEARASRLRVPLTDEIEQVCQIWLALGRAWGVASMEDRSLREASEDSPIILPPRVILDDEHDGDPQLEVHAVGKDRKSVV